MPAHNHYWRGPGWQRRARTLNQLATLDPHTLCWFCKRTLDKHPPTKSGRKAKWSQEHVRKGDPTSPVVSAVLGCNSRDGAEYINALRQAEPHSERW